MEVIFITFKIVPPEAIGVIREVSISPPSKSGINIDIFAVISITCLVLVCAWWAYKVKYNRFLSVQYGRVDLKYTPLKTDDEDVMNLKL